MKLSPYQKFTSTIVLLYLFFVIGAIVVSLTVTHSEQPALAVSFTMMGILILSLMIGGCLQIRSARRQGQRKKWYQQFELTIGLGLLCFLLSFPIISIFHYLASLSSSRLIYYGEIVMLFVCAISSFLFFYFAAKYRPYQEKTNSHPDQEA